MKKIYVTLGLLVALSGYAQNKHTAKADKYFDSYQYALAIKEYEGLIKSKKADSYVYNQLANSYFLIGNSDKAAQYYNRATESEQEAETYFRYAQVLRMQGKYQEAEKQMQTFVEKAPNDNRAIAFRSNPNYMRALQSKDKLFNIKETNLKSAVNEFGAVLTDENVVYFASTRSGQIDKRGTGDAYLDIYQTIYSSDNTLSEPTAIQELNTPYHDGPVTVSADGKTMFFSRDGLAEGKFKKNKKANAKIGKVGLYSAQKVGDKWTNVKALPFNSTDYSVGNPSLSKDGKTLYFASDMPGGFGDNDIWRVSVNGDGTYGTPENLGAIVNTPGKESFPFISEDNILYFASNGLQGFGGYDVYMLDLSGKGTSKEAQNVGKPINSEKDDFALTYNKGKDVGFFSSNRSGVDKIYYAFAICKRDAEVIVKNANTGVLLSGANVTLFDNDQRAVKTEHTNASGLANFVTECDKVYNLQASLKDYEPSSVTLSKERGKTVTEILLTPVAVVVTENEIILNPITFEYDKAVITAESEAELDKLVKILEEHPEMEILVRSHTDERGSEKYNLRLSERRAKATVKYIVSKGINKKRVSGKGFGKSEPKVDCGENCTEEQYAQNRRSEFIIVKK